MSGKTEILNICKSIEDTIQSLNNKCRLLYNDDIIEAKVEEASYNDKIFGSIRLSDIIECESYWCKDEVETGEDRGKNNRLNNEYLDNLNQRYNQKTVIKIIIQNIKEIENISRKRSTDKNNGLDLIKFIRKDLDKQYGDKLNKCRLMIDYSYLNSNDHKVRPISTGVLRINQGLYKNEQEEKSQYNNKFTIISNEDSVIIIENNSDTDYKDKMIKHGKCNLGKVLTILCLQLELYANIIKEKKSLYKVSDVVKIDEATLKQNVNILIDETIALTKYLISNEEKNKGNRYEFKKQNNYLNGFINRALISYIEVLIKWLNKDNPNIDNILYKASLYHIDILRDRLDNVKSGLKCFEDVEMKILTEASITHDGYLVNIRLKEEYLHNNIRVLEHIIENSEDSNSLYLETMWGVCHGIVDNTLQLIEASEIIIDKTKRYIECLKDDENNPKLEKEISQIINTLNNIGVKNKNNRIIYLRHRLKKLKQATQEASEKFNEIYTWKITLGFIYSIANDIEGDM